METKSKRATWGEVTKWRTVNLIINHLCWNIMAFLNGILSKLNGSAGSLTFKQVNGKTVVSEKVTAMKKSNSPMQMRQRTKWGNVVQM